jgi:RHS repeat-associated protein
LYTATYTDTSGVQSTQNFTITVNPTPTTPWIRVNDGAWQQGNWQQIDHIAVNVGDIVDLGPWPNVNSGWTWTGPNGFTSNSRAIYSIALPSGTNVYTATYTNASGVQSSQPFTITVNTTTTAPWVRVNGGEWREVADIAVNAGDTVDLGPWPNVNSGWTWTGPNGFTSTSRALYGIALPSSTNVYTATYTDTSGVTSSQEYIVTVVSQPTTQLYTYSATYDGAGNVTSMNDTVNGDWTIASGGNGSGYDTLNRLSMAAFTPVGGSPEYMCWSYDAFGNRTDQMTVTGAGYQYGPGYPCVPAAGATMLGNVWSNYTLDGTVNSADNGKNQLTGNPWANLLYDSAGNVTYDGTNFYNYDAEGRVCAVQSVTWWTAYGYLYDADGNRVAKGTTYASQWPWTTPPSCDLTTNGFALTESYVLGPSGEQLTTLDGAGNWLRTNVYASGKPIATYDSAGLHFQVTDPLGTRRIQTDATGVLEEQYTNLPFGDGFAASGPQDATPLHFTGKERDTESGNDYFGARYYASTMGRFLSPDYVDDGLDPAPVPGAKFENPQSLNLYSYVLNNPLTSTDPDGNDVQVCDANGQCKTISNDAYIAGQHGNNSGLNVPTLGQVGSSKDANGDFTAVNITDANGNTVGTAKYVAGDSPGLDPYLGNNMAGLHTLGVTGATMSDPRTYVAWEAASAAGAVCVLYCAEAATVLPRAVQSAEMNVSAKVVAYLESKGIPAAAASAMAAKWLSQVGTKGPTLAALKADYQQLNQMVRDHRQSH